MSVALSHRRRRAFTLVEACVSCVIVAVMFTRDHRTEPAAVVPQPSVAANQPPAPREASAAPSEAPVERGSPSQVPSPRVTREAIPMPRVANVFGARTSSVSAAAERGAEAVWPGAENPSSAVAPLFIAPLTPAPIETPAIVIPPLVIAPPKGGL